MKILGIGNAIVDVICKVDDNFISQNGLTKSTMKLIFDENEFKKLFPKKFWNNLHLQIIYYGRKHCKARECYGLTCKICSTCYPHRKKPIKTNKA